MTDRLDIVPVSEWGFFTLPKPMVIAGPCSAESEEQVMETARGLNDLGIHVFRAGIWKPRTHPGSFEGVGSKGLPWLKKVQEELGMKVSCEVASRDHVYESLKYGVDMLWIGARTTANPFLVQEIADALQGADVPVLVKNPVNPDLDLWIGALERLNRVGIKKLGVIHRGFTSFEKIQYRNNPGWRIAVEMRTLQPDIPFFADPSHMGGDKKYLYELSQMAMDLGLDGIMIESHCNPSVALSDAKQQVTPTELKGLLDQIIVREHQSDDSAFNENLASLRTRIDLIDEDLLKLLSSRMAVSRSIGEFKKANNVAIIQTSRWDNVLKNMIAKGEEFGLPKEFVKTIFNAIHEASVQAQNEIMDRDA